MSSLHKSESDDTIFCKLCEILTASSHDYESKVDCGVCRSCNFKFVQPNSKKWKEGWRPSKKQVELFKDEIEKTVYSILNDINNYI